MNMDFLAKLLVSLLNCNGDAEPSSVQQQQQQQSGMQDEIQSEEPDDEAAGPSRGALPKLSSNAQPTAGMLAQFLKKHPLVLTPPGCASNTDTPSTSPTPASPSSSYDKPDNRERDVFAFCPDTPDMRREDERLKTFIGWPVVFLLPESLARNGFYYLGRGDEVRCAFCKVEIMKWVAGDDPAKDHQRWAPQCPFLRRQADSGNVPREPVSAPAPVGHDECGVRAPAPAPAPRMPDPVHARYASKAARMRSFSDWPRSMKQKPEELAEAGFFYTGQGDKTKCFYCDGGLKDWENDDVPWEQHARWFDRCAYVQLVKGRDYVQKVITEACALPAPKEQPEKPATPTSNNADNNIDDAKLCKICYNEERNVVFVPCGHVVACAMCALSTDKCPMCRRTFTNVVRCYFS